MFYLGLDGGGTKTAFVLINESGEVVAFTSKSSCHHIQVGIDVFKKVLTDGIADLCTQASIKKGEIAFSFFGLPGYGENIDDIPKLEAAVKDILQNDRFSCGNDVEAGWAGSLAC
ncbi:MAG TPA: BadF/BadG/BcrA/BcrD ATPase family protein, partial [Halanaerobiales bacterium]|nr:BadF/BadG/BcrA/BcrD ATPase family protein [Halanaerobiales bacterium]